MDKYVYNKFYSSIYILDYTLLLLMNKDWNKSKTSYDEVYVAMQV